LREASDVRRTHLVAEAHVNELGVLALPRGVDGLPGVGHVPVVVDPGHPLLLLLGEVEELPRDLEQLSDLVVETVPDDHEETGLGTRLVDGLDARIAVAEIDDWWDLVQDTSGPTCYYRGTPPPPGNIMTEIHDLRSYIEVLEAANQLARIETPVSLVHELADVAASLARTDTGAGLFTAATDSPWPIFCGSVTSHRRAAVALGCRSDEVIDVMERVLDPSNGVAPVSVEHAVWHENHVEGSDLDTAMLPIPTHSRGDGGAFITGAVTVAKDPISGRGNLGYNRMLRLDARRFGFNVNEWRDVGTFWKSRDDPDAPFPVALAIGLDPAIMIAAGVKTPVDELFIAGAIRGKGIEVCRGRTVDVDIPAAAEVVVEGLLHPAIRESEGPLAEFHGYHGEPWNSPTLEVTCISWRNDPIYQTIIPGWYEHIYIGNVLPREPLLRRFVRHLDPHADVHIPPYGNGFLALVQIDRDNPGTPKNLAMAAMAAHINIRNVIVVDRDVDMFEPAEVQWALTNRVHWGDDVFAVPFAQGHEMDPTADQRGISTKVGIDATYKRERREYGERVSYPAVDLGDYLP